MTRYCFFILPFVWYLISLGADSVLSSDDISKDSDAVSVLTLGDVSK